MDDQPYNLSGGNDGRPPSGMLTIVFVAAVVGTSAFVALWYALDVFGAFLSFLLGGSCH
jgi:hypothetical protein